MSLSQIARVSILGVGFLAGSEYLTLPALATLPSCSVSTLSGSVCQTSQSLQQRRRRRPDPIPSIVRSGAPSSLEENGLVKERPNLS
jgi:hypothetical protein